MRVLMLGNSLTSSQGLPGLVAELCSAEVVAHTRGGARLSEQLNASTGLGARTAEALREGGWDFVVLQEMSVGPIRSRGRYLETVAALSDAVRAAGGVPVTYATWAFREGSARLEKLGMGRREMHDLLHEAFLAAAEEGGTRIADVGTAFFDRGDPGLYARDGVHPSAAGARLAAEVIAETLLA